ncbi:MAG: transcriptional regulator GcvA [Proteobacteria bacterium]|nr:transcriptional regulator GcvA [Pseudomonadota bacterium]
MARKLPPLNALRAFEAAARHLSFTKAAQELHVTQAAISHQVKALEERLSVQMFRRMNRALLLTDEGQAYLPAVREAFDIIDAATARLLERDRAGSLVVSCMPSFAAAWLVRRLGRFRAKHPELDVRIDPTVALVDFMREDVDIAVRYGRGDWSGVVSERFMTEDIVPMCSPELLAGSHPLRTPEDLRHHTLLHDDGHADWRRWLLAMEVEGIDASRGLTFTDSSLVVQAAVQSQGVALGRTAMATDELASGRLVRPFEYVLPVEYAYYIVYPEAYSERLKVAAFRDWLKQEAVREGGTL